MSNLSEEEKKAILHFQKYENKLVYEINEKDKKYAKTLLNLIDRLQIKLRQEKEEKIELRHENYVQKIAIDRLQKEKEGYREQLLNAVEIENKKVNKYWQDKINNKIKELKEQLEHTNTMEWQEIIKKQIEVLEDLLKENSEEIINSELKNNINELISLMHQDNLTEKGKRELEAHIKNMWVAYEAQTRLLYEVKEMYDEECEKVKKLEHEIWHKGKQIDYLIDLLQQEGYLQFDLKQQALDYIDKLIKLEDKE